MMHQLLKSIPIICFLITVAINSFAQDPFSPYNDAKPKGKIDTVVVIAENADGKHVYIYNKHRQLIEVTQYRDEVFPDGIGRVFDTVKTQYTYGANSHLLSGIMTFKGGNKSTVRYIYLPKKYGYAIRAIDSRYKDTSVVNEMRFSKSGQMIQSGLYKLKDLEHQGTLDFEYQYNSKGYLIGKTAYYDSGPADKSSYKYDSNGDEVEIISAGRGYSRKSTYKYSNYDKMHNWTQQALDFVNDYEHDDSIDSIHHQYTFRRHITYYK